MRDNAFGRVMKTCLGVWSLGGMALCGIDLIHAAQTFPADPTDERIHAFITLAGVGVDFAVWAAGAMVLVLGYFMFGRSG